MMQAKPLKSLKSLIRRIPPDTVIPILSGPARGKKWVVGASRNAYWLGWYESAKAKLFLEKLGAGDTVYDIGAHVGYYSLLASGRVGAAGHVIAFEPLPANLKYLYQHLALNHLTNVEIVRAAVSQATGSAHFRLHPSRSMGNLSTQGEIQVKTLSLDDALSKREFPVPQLLKLDIEGAELQALMGAQQLLTEVHPKLFVATHNRELHEGCSTFLEQIGYRVQVLEWDDAQRRGELYAE